MDSQGPAVWSVPLSAACPQVSSWSILCSGPHHLIWSTPDEQAAFHLMAYDLSVEELIRMAESMEIIE